MRTILALALVTALSSVFCTSATAALVADINLDRVREAPEADAVRERLEAVMPVHIQERIAALAQAFDCDPRRDLHRVVINYPDQGAATLRLVGLPAARIAEALAQKGNGIPVMGGLTGYPLPNRPQAVMVAINDSEMLIGRADALSNETSAPPSLAPMDNELALQLRFIPSDKPRAEIMTLVRSLTLTANGQGHIVIDVSAHNQADANELERRLGVVKNLATIGAEGLLPTLARAKQFLDGSVMTRDEDRFIMTIDMPEELRKAAIERLISRVEQRVGHGKKD
jgi:hypothetical protein